ncbi:hypothetical protein CSKR_107456 [Clonorchis sinensis]|uniref:Uncharacterized protein n=1 Tax=Clonorchis sinensis TaxID=79923 RepID=A0A419PYB6_CLOSI|nr:hypothetical protein CSKR_107456 [Clonorchis sinensis]
MLKIREALYSCFVPIGNHQQCASHETPESLEPATSWLTIEQGSKTLICISFTKLNTHLLLERVFLNFFWIFIDCYSTASKCYKETPQIP